MSAKKKFTTPLITLAVFLVLAVVLAGCEISADSTPTPTNVPMSTPTSGPATTSYQPRSFDEVKPANMDLELVSAPNLPECA